MVAVRTCMVVACSSIDRSIDWLLQLPGAVLLIGRAPFVYWGVSNYCALTEVFLLPRIQLCSLHRLRWLLLSYDYCHDYFLVSSMLKLSSLKPSKYTRWILASIGRLVTLFYELNHHEHRLCCRPDFIPPSIYVLVKITYFVNVKIIVFIKQVRKRLTQLNYWSFLV